MKSIPFISQKEKRGCAWYEIKFVGIHVFNIQKKGVFIILGVSYFQTQ